MSYTEADVQLVIDADADAPWPCEHAGPPTGDSSEWFTCEPCSARAILGALAAAGRLLPEDTHPSAERRGYDQAVAVFRGIHERTGSPAAKWAADYLAADPDRMAPPPPVPRPLRETVRDGMWCPFHGEFEGPCSCRERIPVTVTEIVSRRVVEW